MDHVKRILLFVAINIAGFYMVLIATALSARIGILPEQVDLYSIIARSGMVWFACMLLSIGYFLSETKLRFWLLWAPAYVMFLYGVGVVLYFALMNAN